MCIKLSHTGSLSSKVGYNPDTMTLGDRTSLPWLVNESKWTTLMKSCCSIHVNEHFYNIPFAKAQLEYQLTKTIQNGSAQPISEILHIKNQIVFCIETSHYHLNVASLIETVVLDFVCEIYLWHKFLILTSCFN